MPRIRNLLRPVSSDSDKAELFKIIEIEFDGLHDGNIARLQDSA